jgi:hypothetical protein
MLARMNRDELVLSRLFEAGRAEPVPSGARGRALARLASGASAGGGAAMAAGKFAVTSYSAIAAASAFVVFGITGAVLALRQPNEPARHEQEHPPKDSPEYSAELPEVAPPAAGPGRAPFGPMTALDTRSQSDRKSASLPVPGVRSACANLSLPDTTPTTCSTNGEPLLLELVNTCGEETVDLYWVNYQCKEVFYRQLAPGETWTQSTFATHPWRVREHTSHRLLKEVAPTPPTDRAAVVPPSRRPVDEIVIRSNDEAIERVPDAGRCSEAGFPAELSVLNDRAEAIEFYWLDYDCHEIFKGRAEPGGRWMQRTQDTHWWRVRSASTRQLLREFVIDPNSQAARAYVAVP